jgi:hypothetical protein
VYVQRKPIEGVMFSGAGERKEKKQRTIRAQNWEMKTSTGNEEQILGKREKIARVF